MIYFYILDLSRLFSGKNPQNFHALFDRLKLTRHSDPWWIYTTCSLLYNIRTRYEFKYFELMHISPRFGVMLVAMILSIIFTILDVLFVTDAVQSALPVGINPFWKLAFVFKLLTDTVILDDFKTALDKLCAFNLSRAEEHQGSNWSTTNRNTISERATASQRTPPSLIKSANSGSKSETSGDAWIEVTTETMVESIHMDDMNQMGACRAVPRNF